MQECDVSQRLDFLCVKSKLRRKEEKNISKLKYSNANARKIKTNFVRAKKENIWCLLILIKLFWAETFQVKIEKYNLL